MKKLLMLVLVSAMVLGLSVAPALADGVQTVTAQGTAIVTVTPDQASFTAGVTTQDKTVAAAQSANSTAMQAVLTALKAQGVAEEDLQTAYYNISPVYDYSGNSSDQTVTGYSVSNSVTVTVHDLSLLPALLDAAAAAGGNETYGVDFSSTQYAKAYDQALAAAVQDALRKAALMAQALNRTTGAVISLTETNDTSYSYTSGKGMMYDSASSSTPIQSGTLSVSANVTIVVAL
ncbi:MAG: SIMPL domain-containing protein, partial [Eubacteriales bacterium]|nr:SIMPL domain-containing protein [Eubacteriales bacterium]